MSPDSAALAEKLRACLPDPLPRRLGVAISGGSDSTALLRLLIELARTEGIGLFAATVDHGLRPEAATEALQVADLAQGLGVPHETLKWQGWDGAGNLQDQARQARFRLLRDWARRLQLDAVALGHTADDQAETVVMRLARAAGVSGLSGMSPVRWNKGVVFLRPMLSITRGQLQDYLKQVGMGWIDDPSNQDRTFDRIKVRTALGVLGSSGINAQTLSRVAENLAQAREALAQYAQETAGLYVKAEGGALRIEQEGFVRLPIEIRRRILIAAVAWIAGDGYPPRHGAVGQALAAMEQGHITTIGGCILVPKGNFIWVCRELQAVKDQVARPGQLWDGRWIMDGPNMQTGEVRALGEEGIAQLDDWRDLGRPRAAILSTPALWRTNQVISAPLAGFSANWSAKLSPEWPEFDALILSH